MPTLSVGVCLQFGWNRFKERPFAFVAAILLVGVIQAAMAGIQEELGKSGADPSLAFLSFVASLLVSTFLYCGIMNFFLNAHDGDVRLEYLWYPKPFFPYLFGSIIMTLIVAAGLIFLVVPGIYFMLMFFFTGYLIVDKDMDALAALQRSAELTRGNRWKLFLLLVAIVLLAVIGALPLFLGLLVVAPVVGIASVHAYKTLYEAQ